MLFFEKVSVTEEHGAVSSLSTATSLLTDGAGTYKVF